MNATWHIRTFHELSLMELHDLLRLRVDIFVVEQTCPYCEVDGLDTVATHVFARHPDGSLIACARVLPPDDDGLPHIGRVAVRADQRGKGLAGELMQRALEVVKDRSGTYRSALAAQAHLSHFYARYGFACCGEEYLLDGIPHVDMQRTDEVTRP